MAVHLMRGARVSPRICSSLFDRSKHTFPYCLVIFYKIQRGRTSILFGWVGILVAISRSFRVLYVTSEP